jgi:hypothetical protein
LSVDSRVAILALNTSRFVHFTIAHGLWFGKLSGLQNWYTFDDPINRRDILVLMYLLFVCYFIFNCIVFLSTMFYRDL